MITEKDILQFKAILIAIAAGIILNMVNFTNNIDSLRQTISNSYGCIGKITIPEKNNE